MDSQAGPFVMLPTKNPFIPKTVDVEAPSGRKYTLRELNGYEQSQADSVSLTPSDAVYYRVGLSIETVDGEKIAPRGKKEFVDALLRALPGADVEVLAKAFVDAFAAHLNGPDVKNSPTPFAQ